MARDVWSALTCQRFGRLRPVADVGDVNILSISGTRTRFWSAVTCYRFGLRRPVAVVLGAATLYGTANLIDDCDRSQTTKALTGSAHSKGGTDLIASQCIETRAATECRTYNCIATNLWYITDNAT